MKKLLVCLCAGFLLAGCGNGGSGSGNSGDASSNVVKKTCTVEQQGMKAEMYMEGEDDVLSKVSLKMDAPYEAMNLDASIKDQLTDEMKEAFKDEMLKAMELNEDDGYNVSIDFDDEGMKMEVSAEASIFEKTFNASSVEEMTKELEEAGYTCK